jgi:hypothetical protein
MATKKNMAVMIATIKSIYPYYAKDTNIEVLAKTWLLLLQDYDDKIINNALILCMKECEMPPTPAHIIKKIEEMQPKATLTELWVEYVKALREVSRLQEDFNYTFVEANGKSQGQNAKDKARQIYNNLPQELKIYVGSCGELLRKARDIDDTSLKYAENNFMKTMPELRKEHEMRLLGAKSVDMLQENNGGN